MAFWAHRFGSPNLLTARTSTPNQCRPPGWGCAGPGRRGQRAGLGRMLDNAAEGRFTAVRVVWRDRLAQFAGGLDRAVLVGGRRYSRGLTRQERQIAGGRVDG